MTQNPVETLQEKKTIHFCVRLQDWRQHFAHTSAAWNTQTYRFLLRSKEEQQENCLEFCCPVCQVFLLLIRSLPLRLYHTNKKSHEVRRGLRESHTIGPQRPIHRPRKLLFNHARTGGIKYGLAWRAALFYRPSERRLLEYSSRFRGDGYLQIYNLLCSLHFVLLVLIFRLWSSVLR